VRSSFLRDLSARLFPVLADVVSIVHNHAGYCERHSIAGEGALPAGVNDDAVSLGRRKR